MRRLLAAIVLLLSMVPALPAQARWSYTGATGPAHWGTLSPEYSVCDTGHSQSPVDIPITRLPSSTDAVAGTYLSTNGRMFNDGHTVQVNVGSGSFIRLNGRRYDLVQFHFHYPAEHTRRYDPAGPVEIHLVHQDSLGRLAVLAIFATIGNGPNLAWKPLLDRLPRQQGDTVAITTDLPGLFDLANLAGQSVYLYTGSLTTPPCTEGVSWVIRIPPIRLSTAQIRQIQRAFSTNRRPVQTLCPRILSKRIR